jgi:hypothetical protein
MKIVCRVKSEGNAEVATDAVSTRSAFIQNALCHNQSRNCHSNGVKILLEEHFESVSEICKRPPEALASASIE